jgi:uncharacterized protein involved in exopolysaccharide biosynthesis
MNLIQLLRILIARKWIILLPAIACVVVAAIVVSLLPKRYPASARVILDVVKPDPVTGESVAGRDARSYVRTQIELIKDMRVAGLVVDRLGLANDPTAIASYRATGRSESDGGIRAWLGQQIINHTDAGLVSGSSILEITYEAPTPEQAKAVVSALRDAYIESSLRYRIESASNTGAWFRDQSDKAKNALTQAEQRMAQFMGQNGIILVGNVDSETARLQALAAAVQAARSNQTVNDATASARLGNNPVVDQLRMQLAAVEDELALTGARLGPNHPSYKALEARKRTLERQITQAQANSRTDVAAITGATHASLAELEKQLAAQEKLVLARKPILDELTRLARDVELKRTLYENTLSRTQNLQMQADISQTGLVVLGDPTASAVPSYPKPGMVVGLAGIIGLAFGIFAAIVIELVARRVRGPEDLAFAAGAPVLVSVGTAPPSPWRMRLRHLFGRRSDHRDNSTELQAI